MLTRPIALSRVLSVSLVVLFPINGESYLVFIQVDFSKFDSRKSLRVKENARWDFQAVLFVSIHPTSLKISTDWGCLYVSFSRLISPEPNLKNQRGTAVSKQVPIQNAKCSWELQQYLYQVLTQAKSIVQFPLRIAGRSKR